MEPENSSLPYAYLTIRVEFRDSLCHLPCPKKTQDIVANPIYNEIAPR